MEDQASALLAALKKSSAAVDGKLELFNKLKSSIKHLRVPDSIQPTIFDCIRIAIGPNSSSPSLVATGFSTLGHLLKRLQLQSQDNVIVNQSGRLFPILLERFGDPRESHRNAASQVLIDMWIPCDKEVERLVRDSALAGTNPRAKEAAMMWLVKMSKVEGFQFRSFVPKVVANLEDSDGMVRETAKSAVVELFKNAPDRAKSDLKKQLQNYNVRKTIATFILTHLAMGGAADIDPNASIISIAPSSTLSLDSGFANSSASETAPPAEPVSMEPLFVHSQREVDEMFRDMHPHFEGRETEGNWLARDKNVMKLRRLTRGNAPSEFNASFMAGIKGLLDGILKVANSLRTTMSTNGCQLVQELAKTLGPAIDSMSEILLQNFIKMSAATKTIAAQNGSVTVDTLFTYLAFSLRLFQHVWFGCQDKNVQTRISASGWLKTLIRKHAGHRSQLEHSGAAELAEKCIKKGLGDANPKVREGARATYWVFAPLWADRAASIMDTLDPKSKTNLERDPNNPNAPLVPAKSSLSSSVHGGRPGVSSRSTLRDAIAAQKGAARAAAKLPARPGSAQAALSPVKQSSMSSLNGRAQPRPPSSLGRNAAAAASANSTTNGTGSLMSAPVRRPGPRRPELARPATADPFTGRNRGNNTVTPGDSPVNTPARGTVTKSAMTKSAVRPRTPAPRARSPNVSPSKSRSKSRPAPTSRAKTPGGGDSPKASRSKPVAPKNDDLTMVDPFGKNGIDMKALSLEERPPMDKTMSVDSGMARMLEEDTFNMVLPNLNEAGTPGSLRSSPVKTPRMGLASPRPTRNNASPIRSPVRQPRDGSDEVKVYEDPFVHDEPEMSTETDPEKPVLEELPINEKYVERQRSNELVDGQSTPTSTSHLEQLNRGHQKTTSTSSAVTITPASTGADPNKDQADILRSRRLLENGLKHIRARTLETHGFRRLQELVKSKQDIWGKDGQDFSELLLALLSYLECPNDTLKTPPAKAPNLKTQSLACIRAMLTLHRRESAPFYSQALCSILRASQQYDATAHTAVELEKTATEIIKVGQGSDCLNAVLDLVESISPDPEAASPDDIISPSTVPSAEHPTRTLTASLSVLSSLVTSSSTSSALSSSQVQRLGRLAVRFLNDSDADVRKSDLEFCITLHQRLNGQGDAFWKAVKGAREEQLNLIMYYLARRGMA